MAILRIVLLSLMLVASSNLFAGSRSARIIPNKSVNELALQKVAVSDLPQIEAEMIQTPSNSKTHPAAVLMLIFGIAGVFLFPTVSEVLAKKLLAGKISHE